VTQAPKWTLNVGATQKVPTSMGDLTFHLDYAYTSAKAMDAATAKSIAQGGTQAAIDATAIANRASIIKGYGLLNGPSEPGVAIQPALAHLLGCIAQDRGAIGEQQPRAAQGGHRHLRVQLPVGVAELLFGQVDVQQPAGERQACFCQGQPRHHRVVRGGRMKQLQHD
jgi:hypothetical protein